MIFYISITPSCPVVAIQVDVLLRHLRWRGGEKSGDTPHPAKGPCRPLETLAVLRRYWEAGLQGTRAESPCRPWESLLKL